MRRPPLYRQFVLLLLPVILLATGACQRPQPEPKVPPQSAISHERIAGTRGGSLHYRVISPPKTFNYLTASDVDTLVVAFLLMGGRLVELDHDTQRYVPGLAETWKLADDGRQLDLTLRDGLRFSDGHPLTADDVLFTFRAIYDERTASPVFRDAMLIGGRQIEITAPDARRLRLVFPETIAAPENYLSNVAVLPRHALEQELNKGSLREAWSITTEPSRIVSAGAFTVKSVAVGESITLQRNPFYWKKDRNGTSLPYLDTLVIDVVSDANNAVTRLTQGALDILDRLRPTDYATLRQSPQSVRALDLGPGLITDHLWFNLNEGEQNGQPVVNPIKRAWFNNPRFRRAISHAIDRESIASSTLQGLATPLYGFVSPGNRAWAARDIPRADYNLEQARALLREMGFAIRGEASAPELYDANGNRVEFTLIVPLESEARVAMATVIQEDLARLGIRMQVASIETGELTRRTTQSYDYDAALLGISVTEPDPSSYANFLRSSSPTHQWHPKEIKPATDWEARINELITAQARERDVQKRVAIFHDVQLIIAEQLPVVPIVARHITSAAGMRVGNYRPSAIFPYSLWNAEELFVQK
ncbi:MAG: ABC transporter substrate-binding protein [Pyrinomonadaceae bacterium]